MSTILFLLVTTIAALLLHKYLKAVKKAERDQKQRALLLPKIPEIKHAVSAFEEHLQQSGGYFANYAATNWKAKYAPLGNKIVGTPYVGIGLPKPDADAVGKFINYFSNTETIRNQYNQQFLKEELNNYTKFFDNIENRKLDLQQRTAIITDEDNNIVIAGAGSGKTTTIVGKVNYILDRYDVRPDEILLISFTRKSASELAHRIDRPGVQARTFHRFGMDVLIDVEQKKPSVFQEEQFAPLIKRLFIKLQSDPKYMSALAEYFTDHLKEAKTQFEFENRGEYIQYIKDQNFRTYKQVLTGRQTLRMEVVKSIEECKIANFLLFNGVKYEYEFPYEHDTADIDHRQYRPDFKIMQDGRVVYLEHFGINRDGDVPSWFDAKDGMSAREYYHAGIEWKRGVHARYGTILCETYSYEMSEGTLYDNLTRQLQEHGIVLKPKTPAEMWEIIKSVAKQEVDSFVQLLGTFITLMKSNNYSLDDVKARNKANGKSVVRHERFIGLVAPVYHGYQQHLAERGLIDFSDMVNKASGYIARQKYVRKLKYVIVDEFQDISVGRYQMVKAIKSANPGCKLFCVGDDWQSIYRFAGSDISLFMDFEKYFGCTVTSRIETTYRFCEPLIKMSGDFILKNPGQAAKSLRSISGEKETSYKISYSAEEEENDVLAVRDIFDGLIESGRHEKEILIVGRYTFDADRLVDGRGILDVVAVGEDTVVQYSKPLDDGSTAKINARYLTVHKAKGLESDIVIVINCNSGYYGFPAEMSDDEVLNLLLSDADQFPNGEERRLFYVAMTRAKEELFLVANSLMKSKFINELEVNDRGVGNRKCPSCKTADVVLRREGVAVNGNPYRFFGCSNYLYGCGYGKTEFTNLV